MVCSQLSLDENRTDLSSYRDDVVTGAAAYVFDGAMLRSSVCCRVAAVVQAPQSMRHGRLNEADSAAGCDEVDSAV